jgi:hypothetical protein
MNASRAQANRRVDFSKASVSMHAAIMTFLKRREQASLREIQKHFSGTPKEFVAAQIEALHNEQAITIRRNGLSRRAGYVYQPLFGSPLPTK